MIGREEKVAERRLENESRKIDQFRRKHVPDEGGNDR
jgi:hypothetical protein